jgi:DNA-binding transcriptional LysR family regulator
MDLRFLRYFVTVAEELNFTRAARVLHITQPSLSVQVRKLEAEVGAELLTRDGRGIRLSQAGRLFLRHARKILAEAERAVALARRTAKGEIGELSIGYSTPAAEFRVFPRVVPTFKAKWPGVHLRIHPMGVEKLLDGLRLEEIDLGFVWLPVPAGEFEVRKLGDEPLIAAVPEDHRLARAATVSIEDLSAEPLILPTRLMDSATYYQIQQLFLRAASTMNVAYELETLLSALNFVAMGAACSLLPDYARRVRYEGVVYKPMRTTTLVNTLAMVKRKGAGDLTEAFGKFTVDTLRRRQ